MLRVALVLALLGAARALCSNSYGSLLVFCHQLTQLLADCSGYTCADNRCVCPFPSNVRGAGPVLLQPSLFLKSRFSQAPDCSTHWLDEAADSMLSYIVVFTLVFACTLVLSAVQLVRLVYYTGASPTVPKLLHLVIFVQAVLRMAWLMSGALFIYEDYATTSFWMGVLDGMGIAALIVVRWQWRRCWLVALTATQVLLACHFVVAAFVRPGGRCRGGAGLLDRPPSNTHHYWRYEPALFLSASLLTHPSHRALRGARGDVSCPVGQDGQQPGRSCDPLSPICGHRDALVHFGVHRLVRCQGGSALCMYF